MTFNAKILCLPVFLLEKKKKEEELKQEKKGEKRHGEAPFNVTWNQLSALTPPPWEIWTAAKMNDLLPAGRRFTTN